MSTIPAAVSASQFTGKERDAETGLDYFGARYYGSNMGRFMSADPSMGSVRMDNPQTWNRYSYVLNNPLELSDPSGEEWNLRGQGAEWTDTCGHFDDCIKTVALPDKNGVTVYGSDGADDVTRYDANTSGVVDAKSMAQNDDAQFTISPQVHPENFLSPNAAAALYNVAESYHEQNPKDQKLGFNGGSTANGEPACCNAQGNPVHQGHRGGNNIDLRYMSADGKQLSGPTASARGDATKSKEIISGFRTAGFQGAITGNAAKYGSKPVSPSLTKVHETHIHVQQK